MATIYDQCGQSIPNAAAHGEQGSGIPCSSIAMKSSIHYSKRGRKKYGMERQNGHWSFEKVLMNAIRLAAFALLLISGASHAAVIGVFGSNNNSTLVAQLNAVGHTATDFGTATPMLSNLSGLDVVFLLRTTGSADLSTAISQGLGLVTEWSAANYAMPLLGGSAPSGSCTGIAAINFTAAGIAAGLSTSLGTSYSDSGNTECFQTLNNGSGGTVFATNAATAGNAIVGGTYGTGRVLVIGYDWMDAGGNLVTLRTLANNAANWVTLRNYWDGSATNTTSVEGGAGSWDSSSANWVTASGKMNSAWSAGAVANFTVSGGNVAVTGTQSIGGLKFTVNGYQLTGGTLSLAQPATITTPSGGSVSIGSVLSGANALTTTGGTTVLTGANTYSGSTTISSGTLQISGAGSLGAGTYSAGITAGGAFRFSSTTTQTLSGAISGAGALTKDTGTGALTLSGNNNYTGATTVSAGTLVAAHANALGGTSTGTTVSTGASLALSGGISLAAEPLNLSGTGNSGAGALYNAAGSNTYAGPITLNAASTIANNVASTTLTVSGNVTNGGNDLTLDGSSAVTVSGAISGTGGIAKYGTGTAILSSASNSYGGTTTVYAGTLQYGNAAAIPAAGVLTVKSGTILDVNGLSITRTGTTTIDGTLALGNSGNSVVTFSGGSHSVAAITGKGTVYVSDGAQLTLSASFSNTSVNFVIDGNAANTLLLAAGTNIRAMLIKVHRCRFSNVIRR